MPLATGVATLAGLPIARRVSRLLADVAESALAPAEDAVERVAGRRGAAGDQAVVSALQDTLRRIREESENAHSIAGLAHELRSPLRT